MQLLAFIERETKRSYRQIGLIATIAGVANGLLLGLINHAAEAIAQQADLTTYFLMYLTTFVLFLYGQSYAFTQAIQLMEEAIYRVRTRLLHKTQQLSLASIEEIGSQTLYERLTQNDVLLSQVIPQLVGAVQMSAVLLFSLIYLSYVSFVVFIVTLVAVAIGILYFLLQTQLVRESLREVNYKESGYSQTIKQLIAGFKELKVNRDKADALLTKVNQTAQAVWVVKDRVARQESTIWGFGRLFIYALLPIVVFILPSLMSLTATDIFKISATLLLLVGPITVLVNIIPLLNRVDLAVTDIVALEAWMDQALLKHKVALPTPIEFDDFQSLCFDNVSFTYPSATGNAFSIKTLSGCINRGELLFIIGGNGSGKSTFLKLLTGLYQPNIGQLCVDNTVVNRHDYLAYQALFSIVFTDFHLFDHLYGIVNVNAQTVQAWLVKMQLQHKVSFHDGNFDYTDLSTGQRKRLAFIAAILENKPILVLDEFAVDQDPAFRRYFYEVLLPELKQMGKTIIAVTHDEHYFQVADRLWKMDEGYLE